MISTRPAPRVNLLLALGRALSKFPQKMATNQVFIWAIRCYRSGILGCTDFPTCGQDRVFYFLEEEKKTNQ